MKQFKLLSQARPLSIRTFATRLDNYGLSLLKAGRVELAVSQFEKARVLRKDFGTERDLAQSAANLGRQALFMEKYEQAALLFAEALGNSEIDTDDHLLANASCGLAEARLKQNSCRGRTCPFSNERPGTQPELGQF